MKWYNYKNKWYDIEKLEYIELHTCVYNNGTEKYQINFNFQGNFEYLSFDSMEERDMQFEKIKALMGVKCSE